MSVWLWVAAGYLGGSIPSGYLAARIFRGVDIRTYGSGNIGATNVGRLMGRGWAIGVALFDMAKGGLVVLLARLFGVADPWILASVGMAGVCGHNFPMWLGFHGGKGVATSYGVLFFLDPATALAGGAVWFLIMKGTRYVSVASMLSLWITPFVLVALSRPFPYAVAAAAMAALSLVRHRSNIRNLLSGEEGKVGK
ncbi:MAG: glycerol-3-phosphate 1-O-acyltransferase PlsY [Synergistota bacterium]|nr:glycerol-3-phosphate 1-O-acyltransferase PlsY [Synergistota bacterium]